MEYHLCLAPRLACLLSQVLHKGVKGKWPLYHSFEFQAFDRHLAMPDHQLARVSIDFKHDTLACKRLLDGVILLSNHDPPIAFHAFWRSAHRGPPASSHRDPRTRVSPAAWAGL